MTTSLARPADAVDTLGVGITVTTEVVDGTTLVVLERDGEVVVDFDPAQALGLAHALRAAG